MTDEEFAVVYAARLEEAIEFQDFVFSLLFERGLCVQQYASRRFQYERGESSGGIEVKHDTKLAETKNLFIETEEKTRPSNVHYVPSGIYRPDNSWLYAIGDYRVVYVFTKRWLQQTHEHAYCREVENATKTARGYLLPELKAIRHAALVLKPKR